LKFGFRHFPSNRGSLTILTFHRVLGSAHGLISDWPTAAQFSEKLRWFSHLTKVVSLAEGFKQLSRGSGEHLGAITFDDGYVDNLEVAVPVLKAHHLPATFFIATGYIGDRMIFDDAVIQSVTQTQRKEVSVPEIGIEQTSLATLFEKRKFADNLIEKLKYVSPLVRDQITKDVTQYLTSDQLVGSMMDEKHLRALHGQGMDVQSHSHEHFVSTVLTNDEFKRDCETSVSTLTAILGTTPTIFAFPNGIPNKDFNRDHIDIVKSLGFQCAVSTEPGVASLDSNRFSLPRLIPWQSNQLRFKYQLLKQRVNS
jgi:peptidoglycan/xylan/chitin deacetylase (PgdA/CDA1 family)